MYAPEFASHSEGVRIKVEWVNNILIISFFYTK
jgi:hypothetical protein